MNFQTIQPDTCSVDGNGFYVPSGIRTGFPRNIGLCAEHAISMVFKNLELC